MSACIAAQEASKSAIEISPFNINFHTHADITIPPRAVNVSINGVAEFTCTAVANSFAWEANGQQRDNEKGIVITSVLVNEVHISTFRMTVSSTDNATNITCIAFRLTPLSSDVSNPALLLVQGIDCVKS